MGTFCSEFLEIAYYSCRRLVILLVKNITLGLKMTEKTYLKSMTATTILQFEIPSTIFLIPSMAFAKLRFPTKDRLKVSRIPQPWFVVVVTSVRGSQYRPWTQDGPEQQRRIKIRMLFAMILSKSQNTGKDGSLIFSSLGYFLGHARQKRSEEPSAWLTVHQPAFLSV